MALAGIAPVPSGEVANQQLRAAALAEPPAAAPPRTVRPCATRDHVGWSSRRQVAVDALPDQLGREHLDVGAADDQHQHQRSASARTAEEPHAAAQRRADVFRFAEFPVQACGAVHQVRPPNPSCDASPAAWPYAADSSTLASTGASSTSCERRSRRRSRCLPSAPRACPARRSGRGPAPGSGRRCAPC